LFFSLITSLKSQSKIAFTSISIEKDISTVSDLLSLPQILIKGCELEVEPFHFPISLNVSTKPDKVSSDFVTL
jgi:hypothetical protein